MDCLGMDSVWSHAQLHSRSYGPSHSHGFPWHGQCLVSRAAPLKILRPLTLTWIALAWTVFGLTRSSTQDLTAPHTHMDCLGMDSVWSHAQLQTTFYGPSHSHKLPWHGQCLVSRAASLKSGPSHSHGLSWHGQCLVSRAAPGNILRPFTLT